MPKFNVKKLQGLGEELAKTDDVQTGTYKVGAGLLSEVSKDKNIEDDIIYLKRSQIVRNENNHYSINNIDSLAWSISIFGLIQPLHVKRLENGQYKLLGGERRLTAIEKLIDDETKDNWTEDSLIRCIEKDPDDIELPLDSNAKEFLSIITTNKEARKYTDADRLMEIREWKNIIESLRENGVESITFPTQDGEEQELAIKGEATRDIIAQATGLSRGSINKFEKVEIQGSEAVKKAVMGGDASINTASEMVALLSKEEQEDLLNGAEEKVTLEMVRKKAEEAHQEGLITPQRFQKDTKEILKILKKEKIILNEQEQKQYDDCISTLKNLLCEKES